MVFTLTLHAVALHLGKQGAEEIAFLLMQIIDAQIPGSYLFLKDEITSVEGDIHSSGGDVVGGWAVTRAPAEVSRAPSGG